MKKYLALALCALTFASFGAVLFTQKEPVSGKEIAISNYGKISSVDVFSTEANGTVELSRVFTGTIYTNVYDITTTVSTNVVNNPTDEYKFVMNDEHDFCLKEDSSSQTIWSSTITNVLHYLGYMKDQGKWYFGPTNFIGTANWNEKTGSGSLETVDIADGAGFTNVFVKTLYSLDHWTTNVVTTVTTNSITPVKHYDLTVTNQIFSGACSNNCFHGSPSPDLWIFNGDKILFSGTATGGELRIVIE